MRGGKMLLHSAAPRGWVTGWCGPPFLVWIFYLCWSEGDGLSEG